MVKDKRYHFIFIKLIVLSTLPAYVFYDLFVATLLAGNGNPTTGQQSLFVFLVHLSSRLVVEEEVTIRKVADCLNSPLFFLKPALAFSLLSFFFSTTPLSPSSSSQLLKLLTLEKLFTKKQQTLLQKSMCKAREKFVATTFIII